MSPARHLVPALITALCGAALATAAAPGSAQTQLLWGDTHLHTAHSVDAYSNGTYATDPDTAYRFAKGLPVLHTTARTRIRIDRPLDFLVVADHAEMMELQLQLKKGEPRLLGTPSGQRLAELLKADPRRVFQEVVRIGDKPAESALVKELESPAQRRATWAAIADAADKHNQPGRFTALIGWEWSSAPGGLNLHRVIFTPADAATAKRFIPFSYYDSLRPEDLWAWLDRTQRETGAEFMAIPHNSNLSDGLMFDTVDSAGRPLTAEYARTRLRWEPVMEVTQVKGTSEVHPALSPQDRQAGFEIRNQLLAGAPAKPAEGSYARSALLRGLALEQGLGVNPYKFGMIGSTDSHTGLSSAEEFNFHGKLAGDMLPEQRVKPAATFRAWDMSASGMAAVWATDNTRQAITEAFRRKEVYATSGTRIALRVFGGFHFTAADARLRDIASRGYRGGVPMGGDLTHAPKGRAPTLLIHAVRDPLSKGLDSLQVVKGWLAADGSRRERIYDATQADAGGEGATQLATVWRDPDFDPAQRAFYYVRVLERPTPRHQTYDAQALGIDPATLGYPLTIQERAWSSPVWYTP
jgi:Protein of unknown function (DUF3604)